MSQKSIKKLNASVGCHLVYSMKSKNRLCFKNLYYLNFILCFLILYPTLSYSNDFPNYFKELVLPTQEHVQKTSNADNKIHQKPQVSTQHAQDLIEKAMHSILKRLQIPYADGDKIKNHDFFEKLEQKARQNDPNATVLIAGGVVRSLLGYIYSEVYKEKTVNPHKSTEQILLEIAASKSEIPSLEVLGSGSDLDLLMITHKEDEKTWTTSNTKQALLNFVNSVESKSNLRHIKSKLKYSIVPIGDIKNYDKQLERTQAQGGSTMDWLAFPVTGSGHMKTPTSALDVFHNYILGTTSHLPPKSTSAIEDPDKQTIRGLRLKLESPQVDWDAEGEKQLVEELKVLIKKVENGDELSPGAIEQIKKAVRNSRFGGAHNWFYTSDYPIAKLGLELSKALGLRENELPLIPEFVKNQDPAKRGGADPCGLQQENLLVDQKEFLTSDSYTNAGSVYHGTPTVDNILAIIRSGLVVSDDGHGTADFGRGAYASRDRAFVRSYGIPIELKFRKDVPLRILDWKKIQADPGMKQKMESLIPTDLKNEPHPFKYLAEHCNVDVIFNHHVLIQNSGALELPKNAGDLIKVYSTRVEGGIAELGTPDLKAEEVPHIFNAIEDYRSFHDLGELIGVSGLMPVPDLYGPLKVLLAHPQEAIRVEGLLQLQKAQPNDIKFHRLVKGLLRGSSPKVLRYALSTLRVINGLAVIGTDVALQMELAKELNNSDWEVKASVARTFEIIQPKEISIHLELAKLLKDPNVSFGAAEALRAIMPTNDLVHLEIAKALKDPRKDVKIDTIKILTVLQPTNALVLRKLAKMLNDPDEVVRYLAAEAFVTIKAPDVPTQLALAKALRHPDSDLLQHIPEALIAMKPTDDSVHLEIAQALKDPRKDVRYAAARVLKAIQPTNALVYKALVEALSDPLPPLRKRIANILQDWNQTRAIPQGSGLEKVTTYLHKHPNCEIPLNQIISTEELESILKVLEAAKSASHSSTSEQH